MLTLYNLQKKGTTGKSGYFRWKEHICAFIDKHWNTFFGYARLVNQIYYLISLVIPIKKYCLIDKVPMKKLLW